MLPKVAFVLLCFDLIGIGCARKGLEAQLYEDILYDYNKIPRPVKNSTDVLVVYFWSSLIRIIDVDEKNVREILVQK